MSPFSNKVAKIGSGSSSALRSLANTRIIRYLSVAPPTPRSRRRLLSVLEEQVGPGTDALGADKGQVNEEYGTHSRFFLGYS